jgi:hypothetical protein
MMRPALTHLQAYVCDLLAEYEIRRIWCDRPTQAWAAVDIWEVCIAPIRSEISYATPCTKLAISRAVINEAAT